MADQVRRTQSTMEYELDISVVGMRAVWTPSMREWSTALSRLHRSLISYPLGRGSPRSLQGEMVPTRSVSPVDMEMT